MPEDRRTWSWVCCSGRLRGLRGAGGQWRCHADTSLFVASRMVAGGSGPPTRACAWSILRAQGIVRLAGGACLYERRATRARIDTAGGGFSVDGEVSVGRMYAHRSLRRRRFSGAAARLPRSKAVEGIPRHASHARAVGRGRGAHGGSGRRSAGAAVEPTLRGSSVLLLIANRVLVRLQRRR